MLLVCHACIPWIIQLIHVKARVQKKKKPTPGEAGVTYLCYVYLEPDPRFGMACNVMSCYPDCASPNFRSCARIRSFMPAEVKMEEGV